MPCAEYLKHVGFCKKGKTQIGGRSGGSARYLQDPLLPPQLLAAMEAAKKAKSMRKANKTRKQAYRLYMHRHRQKPTAPQAHKPSCPLPFAACCLPLAVDSLQFAIASFFYLLTCSCSWRTVPVRLKIKRNRKNKLSSSISVIGNTTQGLSVSLVVYYNAICNLGFGNCQKANNHTQLATRVYIHTCT